MNLEYLHRLVYIALLTATATIIGIVESLLPSPFAFAPGAKFGFANLIVLMAIFTLKKSDVIILMVLKLLLTALFTGFSVFLYSMAGGFLSLLAMYLVKLLGPRLVSLIGISLVGGFFQCWATINGNLDRPDTRCLTLSAMARLFRSLSWLFHRHSR